MREELPDLLNRAAYLHMPTLVTRQGSAVAVLVSVRVREQIPKQKAADREADNVQAGTGPGGEME